MNELIKIQRNENNEQVVSGRELYDFLEVKTRYNDWINDRIERYGFLVNRDFVLVTEKKVTNNPRNPYTNIQDHLMKLSMAKEVAMTENNERGRQARLYFIACEEAWNSPEMVLLRANQIQQRMLESYTEKINILENKIQEQAPQVLFANAVAASHTSILVGELAKILKQNGIDIGANRLFTWLRENGYLISRNGTDWNMPTQRSMDLGLFEIKESTSVNPDGSVRVNKTPKVTGKGQQYFINKFLKIA